MDTLTERPLVIEGGKKIFHKDLNVPNPIPESAFSVVNKIMASGKLFRYACSGPEDSEAALLERDFAEYLGCKYALAVSSCSSAIFIALLCAGLQPGDKVLVPGFTFTAVPSSILHAGGVPVLVECKRNYTIDVDDLARKIQPDTKYLLLSHMRGHVSQMDRIVTLCKENGIVLIEDAAHSLGARFKGKYAGTFGLAGCFSFQSHKMINAGEGGMLVTDDEEIIAKAILYAGSFETCYKKHFIRTEKLEEFQKAIPTYNLRLSNLVAAIARTQVPLINSNAAKYNANFDVLRSILKTSSHIDLPDVEEGVFKIFDSAQFNLVGLSSEQIQTFLEALAMEGIGLGVFGIEKDNARCFWNWKYMDGETQELPRTRKMLVTACDLKLPLYLTPEDMRLIGHRIVSALNFAAALKPEAAA